MDGKRAGKGTLLRQIGVVVACLGLLCCTTVQRKATTTLAVSGGQMTATQRTVGCGLRDWETHEQTAGAVRIEHATEGPMRVAGDLGVVQGRVVEVGSTSATNQQRSQRPGDEYRLITGGVRGAYDGRWVGMEAGARVTTGDRLSLMTALLVGPFGNEVLQFLGEVRAGGRDATDPSLLTIWAHFRGEIFRLAVGAGGGAWPMRIGHSSGTVRTELSDSDSAFLLEAEAWIEGTLALTTRLIAAQDAGFAGFVGLAVRLTHEPPPREPPPPPPAAPPPLSEHPPLPVPVSPTDP